MHSMKEIIQDIHGGDNWQKMLDNNPSIDNKLTKLYCWELLHHIGNPT